MKQESINSIRYTHIKDIGEALGLVTLYWNICQFEKEPIISIYRSDEHCCCANGYIGNIKPVFKDDKAYKPLSFEFNGKSYKIFSDAVKAVEKYNESLEFPVWTYDPTKNILYRVREKAKWYMDKVLNYKFDDTDYIYSHHFDMFSRRNMYGVATYKIHIIWDNVDEHDTSLTEDDACKGKINYMIRVGEWVEKSFSTIDGFITAINGFVEPFMLTDNSVNIDSLSNMDGKDRDYQSTLVSSQNIMKVERTKTLAATKKALLMALERIEKQERQAQTV